MSWTLVVGAAGIVAAVGWLALVANRRQRIVLGVCAAGAVVWFVSWWPLPSGTTGTAPGDLQSLEVASSSESHGLPQAVREEGFVSADECRECHASQHASWHETFHRTMTQVASAESVSPSWDDVTLTSRGRTYRLFRQDDEFWVDTVDPAAELRVFIGGEEFQPEDLPRTTRQIVMTTGSHHHQTYWMQNPNGVLIQFPWVYHINTERWVYRIDSFLRPPTDVVTYNVWNLSCIACHTTGGQPRVDPLTKTMYSAGELGIACEACHGPGEAHVALARSKPELAPDDWRIVHPGKATAEVSSQICGQCHIIAERTNEEHWQLHGDPYRAGGDHFDIMRRVVLNAEDLDVRDEHHGHSLKTMFWPDGTVRTGGREYNGLLRSRCYTAGQGHRQISCLSCHAMHGYESTSKLLASEKVGDVSCTQCHTESQYAEQLATHTHHDAASEGSRCVNCHMPHTSYALFSAIRSHRIQSPQTRPGVVGARPNACNLCHLDRTVAWTADRLREWYQVDPPGEPTDDEANVAAGALWLLKGDAAQRSVAAWHMGWPPARAAASDDWIPPLLATALDDPYSAIRYMAYEALKQHSGFEEFDYAFDAPAEDRRQAMNRALALWNEQQRTESLSGEQASRLLLTAEGARDEAKIRRLLDRQDTRPITILE